MGGPVATPAEFFTSAAAKAMYKNRLRYIVARWGYSTGIAVWEFFNEVDNAMYNGETVIISHASVTQWHTEMSAYLKSIDPYDHVVSTSISHRQINGLFSVPDIDINQQHIYKFTGNIPGMLSNNTTGKPFVIGEFGYEWDWNIDFQTIASELDFDFKRGLWYGLFNPTPILPMSWWWEFFNDRSTDTYFSAVRQINDHMLSVGNGSFTKMNTTSPGGGIELFAVKCGNQYFVCAINTTTASSTNKTISLAVTADNTFSVKGFDPENLAYHDIGTVTSVSKSLQIGGLSFSSRESKIFIVTAQGDIQGLQVPFDTDPFSIPGQIEVEHFDFGGEGISYHDLEAVNLGGAYRTTEGVDVEDGNGGKIVSHTVTGEWLEYTVNVQKRATYNLEFTLASAAAGNSFQVVLDEKVIATVDVPVTGDLQTWQVMSLTTPALDAGVQHLKILFTSSGFNIDKLNFSLANIAPEVSLASPLNGAIVTLPEMVDFNVTASDEDGTLTSVEFYDGLDKIGEDDSAPYAWSWQGTVGQHKLSAVAIDDEGLSTTESVNVRISPSTVQTPFHGTASEIPGKIEAEDLDMGAGGIACFDLTAGNIKGQYRSDTEADIEVCTDEGGGFNLADIQNSEWVEYTVHVADAGKYDFDFRVATQMSGQKFKVALNGQAVGSIAVPNTGTWQTWKTVTLPKVLMPAGEVVLRLTFESEYFNLNYINVRKSVVTDIMEEEIPEAVLYPNPADHEFKLVPGARAEQFSVFDVAGRKVFSSTVSRQPEVTFGSQLHPGIYMVLVAYNGNQYQWIKAVKRD
jgi:hypothetical protein